MATTQDRFDKARNDLKERLELFDLLTKAGSDAETARALKIALHDVREAVKVYNEAAEEHGHPAAPRR